MTKRALTALVWKEYRQHIALWTAMIVMCVLFQIVMYAWFHWVMPSVAEVVNFAYMTTCSCVFVVIYAIVCSAILFAKEKEDKTDHFLRNMPISGNVVLVGKLLWLFGSMAALVLIFLIVSLVWWAILGSKGLTFDNFLDGLYWFFLYLFFGISSGLFWTSITRKQLHAVVGTLATLPILALIAALFVLSINRIGAGWIWNNNLQSYFLEGTFYTFTAVLGALGLRNCSRWLRKREDKTLGAKIDALQDAELLR